VDIYFISIVFLLIVKLFIPLLHLLYYSFIARVYVYIYACNYYYVSLYCI